MSTADQCMGCAFLAWWSVDQRYCDLFQSRLGHIGNPDAPVRATRCLRDLPAVQAYQRANPGHVLPGPRRLDAARAEVLRIVALRDEQGRANVDR